MEILTQVYRKVRSSIKEQRLKLRYWRLGKNIILIYSMGKVASTTLHSALYRKLPHVSIFHIHFLSDYWLEEMLPKYDSFFHSNIQLGKNVRQFIGNHSDKRLKIITLVREPIIREISDIFENAPGIFGKDIDISQIDLVEYMDNQSFEYALTWFDSEFRNYVGFDIYNQPFDKERGYSIYSCLKADILCLKVEKLNNIYKDALKDFLGIDNIKLSSRNTSQEKAQKELYFQLKGTYKMDVSKLEQIYASKYVRHFYTEEEIESFKDAWTALPGLLKNKR